MIEFWRTVDRRRSSKDCWLWQGCKYPNGYGQVGSKKYGSRYAHRVAWALTNGAIPAGQFVCHHCDTPACCNPAHLFLGTPKDNSQDMVRKHRAATRERNGMYGNPNGVRTGIKNPAAKINDILALQIFKAEGTQREIASKFGVSQTHVSQIKRRINWRHIHVDL